MLGIDPGLTRCGVGVVDVAGNRSATLVHVGVIRSDPGLPIEQRLALIAAGIRDVLARHQPDVVAVERVFAQQNRHSVMGTAQASGIALLLAAEHGLPAAPRVARRGSGGGSGGRADAGTAGLGRRGAVHTALIACVSLEQNCEPAP